MTQWAPIPADPAGFGPAIVGWAGSPQVMRAFHDGTDWFAIVPVKSGTVRTGGLCVKLTECPTHFLPTSLVQEIWEMPADMVVAA